MADQPFKYALGQPVKHIVTGFKGVVTSQSRHLTGCNTYGVCSTKLKDGLPQEPQWFDENTLVPAKGKTIKPIRIYSADEGGKREEKGGPFDKPKSTLRHPPR